MLLPPLGGAGSVMYYYAVRPSVRPSVHLFVCNEFMLSYVRKIVFTRERVLAMVILSWCFVSCVCHVPVPFQSQVR